MGRKIFNICDTIRSLLRDASGATSIEYSMIAALVSIIAVAAYANMTQTIETNYFDLLASIPR